MIHAASSQWASRPADERFWTLADAQAACRTARENSTIATVPITLSRADYLAHVRDSDGLCVACGAYCAGGVEPDANGYECEECDEDRVMGFENALMDGWIEVSP
jgi:hypothetical protein